MFKIGDKVRPKSYSSTGGLYRTAVVTEITERGFRWKLDSPQIIHPFFGWYDQGECFQPETYELVETDEKSDRINWDWKGTSSF